MAAELDASENYRVLRRLEPLPLLRGGTHSGYRVAIVLDTETTGLVMPGTHGAVASEIVSLAMVAIAYDPVDGNIRGAIGRFHELRQPSHPIPEEATKVHGIKDKDVRDRTIGATEIAEWIALVTAAVQDHVHFGSRDETRLPLIVAHNARFDRGMVEELWPEIFEALPWACSLTQVPWADWGYEGSKLSYLGTQAGFFYGDRHSALADADAVVALLRQRIGEGTAMATLRKSAQSGTTRLYVTTPYNPATIATLKMRGYRWHCGDRSRGKAWYWEGKEGFDAEVQYLHAKGFIGIETVRVDCFDQFSRRA